MTDTPPHIRQLQLDLWLSKPPGERLKIALEDNDALFTMLNELKKNYKNDKEGKVLNDPGAD